ncbi:MAG: long-chain fatty acid--CoA ligase [Brevibacillus sp.]|nr:long-chain fatty acid--CoA ligase [Brevibacillus sp.]
MSTPSGNFGELTYEAMLLSPDKTAVISEGVELSYRQLDQRMNQAGHLFQRHGVQKGDRVAILFPNDIRYLEICFGLMRIGAVPLPLNIKLGKETLAYILGDSGAKVLVFHETLAEKAAELADAVALDHLFAAEDSQSFSFARSYDQQVAHMPTSLTIEPMAADDLCLLIYTSGSTGNPKGCMLTHGGQWWNADTNRKIIMLERDDRALVAVPMYHKNAMINAVKPVLMAGASMVILPYFDPAEVASAIHEHRCTYTTGVPAMYKMLLTHVKEESRYDLSSLRFIICGSSEVPPELVSELRERLGVSILEAYGLTEGGPQVLVSPRWGIHKQGSAGLPLPDSEVKIVSTDGSNQVLPAGEVGELWVKNPGVAKGYWNLPEITKERISEDGWLKTGDLVRLDEDGYGYIVGRKDDMMIIGGENAYPKEIENVLLSHPEIEDVSVVAIPHELKGKVPVAFVKTVRLSTLSEQSVKEFYFQNGPAFSHPRQVVFLDEMPLNGTGKINKAALVEMITAEGKNKHVSGS